MASSGISGLSVSVITAGGLLIYAGIRGVTPLQALRDVSTGKPPPVANRVAGVDITEQGGAITGAVLKGTLHLDPGPFMNDQYSRLQRENAGHSDCSSFVAKIYHAAGVAKPDGRMAWPNTTAFAVGPAWKTIAREDTHYGDIAVVEGVHMVMITADKASQAIGQQNKNTDVQTGTISYLFTNVDGPIVYRTYVGL